MSLFNLAWDLHQQRQIREAKDDIQQTRTAAERAGDEFADLERRTDILLLTCQAMWELLREQTGIDEGALLKKIQEVDLRDGKLDGRMGSSVVTCSKCGRTGRSNRRFYIYYGEATSSPHVFERGR